MSQKTDKAKVQALIHSIGLKYRLSDQIIKEIVESPYLFTAEKMDEIANIDLLELSEEEQEKLKSTFMYKSFGKMFLSLPYLKRLIKQKESLKKFNQEKWKNKQ